MPNVVIARLIRPRGVKGELSSVPFSDVPGRFESLRRVSVNGQPFEVERTWRHRDRVIFKFSGVDSIPAAQALAGAEVSIAADDGAALEKGSYFQSDLIGCRLFERISGSPIGSVRGLEEYGGPPLLEVDDGSRSGLLIPFARSICVNIDIGAKRIEVDLPEGLKDLNRE